MSTLCVKCGIMVQNLAIHMNVVHAATQSSTAPGITTSTTVSLHWCAYCKKNVNAYKGGLSGKMICLNCGGYTANDSPTEPMLAAAKPVAVDNTIELVLCNKCGCTYSAGTCPSHGNEWLARKRA